jgi:hypothetical protein
LNGCKAKTYWKETEVPILKLANSFEKDISHSDKDGNTGTDNT